TEPPEKRPLLRAGNALKKPFAAFVGGLRPPVPTPLAASRWARILLSVCAIGGALQQISQSGNLNPETAADDLTNTTAPSDALPDPLSPAVRDYLRATYQHFERDLHHSRYVLWAAPDKFDAPNYGEEPTRFCVGFCCCLVGRDGRGLLP
ncbi:hypothetical protein BDZ88DRAFT_488053, partial [Geranomyces variabilis]